MVVWVWFVWALLCYFVAEAKGREPWPWAAWGLLGGIISLVILLCKPTLPRSRQ